MEPEDRIREIVESGVNDEGFETFFGGAVSGRGCGNGNDGCDKDEKAISHIEDLKKMSLGERISEIMEENDIPSFGGDDAEGQDGETSDNTKQGGSDVPKDSDGWEDKPDDEKSKKEDFKTDDLNDFMKKTETKVRIQKVACEPSPIFGPDDLNRHNKFKVTLTNKKGSAWIYFWDSVANTESGKRSSLETMVSGFGCGCEAVKDGQSLDEFVHTFGYDLSERSRAQRDYDGCRKLYDRCKKIFDEKQIDELIRLSNDI